jgi:hypothetical protein
MAANEAKKFEGNQFVTTFFFQFFLLFQFCLIGKGKKAVWEPKAQ